MKHRTRLILAVVAGCLGLSHLARAEVPDCDKLPVPRNIEGQVIKIEQDKLIVRTTEGTILEFQASAKEMLQDYKTGDTIKASLRTPPECERK